MTAKMLADVSTDDSFCNRSMLTFKQYFGCCFKMSGEDLKVDDNGDIEILPVSTFSEPEEHNDMEFKHEEINKNHELDESDALPIDYKKEDDISIQTNENKASIPDNDEKHKEIPEQSDFTKPADTINAEHELKNKESVHQIEVNHEDIIKSNNAIDAIDGSVAKPPEPNKIEETTPISSDVPPMESADVVENLSDNKTLSDNQEPQYHEVEMENEDFDNLSLQDVNILISANENEPRPKPKMTAEIRLRIGLDPVDKTSLTINVVDAFDLARPASTTASIKSLATESVPPILAYSVHVTNMPTKKQRLKTKMRQGPDPYFDENIKFTKINIDETRKWCLRLRLYGSMRNSMTTVIGEGYLPLELLNIDVKTEVKIALLEVVNNLTEDSMNTIIYSRPCKYENMSSVESLEKVGMDLTADSASNTSELLLGMTYNFNTGRLTVEIVRGNKFPMIKENKPPDTFIKLALLSSRGEELENCKTTVKKATCDPVFEEKFVFQVLVFQINEVSLSITGFMKMKMGKKCPFGSFIIGTKGSTEEEITHWKDLCESKTGDQIVRWHDFVPMSMEPESK